MRRQIISLSILLLLSFCSFAQAPWYHSTTIYQIYPRSFYDSDGDGIGDLQGIINKLDYIKQTGFQTIWVSPFYVSPQQDHGYDVADYCDITPEYGTLELAQKLIDEVHARDMHILFDMVLNHTSDQHPWFVESASSKDNPKADWYVWQDGDGKGPPNNWKSMIGGAAWHYSPQRDQWYYAAFLPFQPDLNYHNPEVKEAMFNVVRFWLDRGVDGFRLDLFNSMLEDPEFKDNPFSWTMIFNEDEGFFQKMENTLNYSATYTFAGELRKVMDEYSQPQRFLLGEVFGDYQQIKDYTGHGSDKLHLAFLFDMLAFDLEADYFRQKLAEREEYFPKPYMPVYAFSNHDRKRSISRMDNDPAKAKLLATFQLTARGVPVVYMGEELGMTQARIPLKEAQDPLAIKYGWLPQFMVNMSDESLNRDECRTPVQWDTTTNAGFTKAGVTPWLPVQPDYPTVNAATEMSDSTSLWWCFHDLLQLREEHAALHDGTLSLVEFDNSKDILAYTRSTKQEQMLILLNFSGKAQTVDLQNYSGKIVYSTYLSNGTLLSGNNTLPPFGTAVVQLGEK